MSQMASGTPFMGSGAGHGAVGGTEPMAIWILPNKNRLKRWDSGARCRGQPGALEALRLCQPPCTEAEMRPTDPE